ncbi:hypothetical protein [Paraclostridium sordellii]|uniref:hypothetical protein n=1 Tax=Paraclostridium sordellii TaxID=1505 RepID=UPI00189B5A69|nr:hypothetical protein [Paeniclostridium sordellii]
MEKWEIFKLGLEIIVLLGSIISAVISWINKNKTKEDVDYIKQVKESIMEKQKMEEISKITEKVKDILEKIRVYSTKVKKISSTGSNLNKDISNIKESLTIIKEHRSIFDKDKNYSDKIYKNITDRLNRILDMEDKDDIVKELRSVETKLDEFLAELKELIDIKKYDQY